MQYWANDRMDGQCDHTFKGPDLKGPDLKAAVSGFPPLW